MMQQRLSQLDLLRVLSVGLVMYGHFVIVAGDATSIPTIIQPGVALPIIDTATWRLMVFEVFLVENMSTQSAVLGVSLFYMITGYLVPMMMERYSRSQFLINRFFRIFPTLCAALIVISAFVFWAQGITFSLKSHIASHTLTYEFAQTVPVTAVLWTLVVEVLFYLLACLIGRFSFLRICVAQIGLLVLILASAAKPEWYFLKLAAIQAKYILMILIGSAAFVAGKKSNLKRQVGIVIGAVVVSFSGFQIARVAHQDLSSYASLGNHLVALAIFLGIQTRLIGWLGRLLPRKLLQTSDLVYPLYLMHASLGLPTMLMVRQFTHDSFLILFAGIAVSMVASFALHLLVEAPAIRLGRKCVNAIGPASHGDAANGPRLEACLTSAGSDGRVSS